MDIDLPRGSHRVDDIKINVIVQRSLSILPWCASLVLHLHTTVKIAQDIRILSSTPTMSITISSATLHALIFSPNDLRQLFRELFILYP